jgi:hypothetical protein
MYNPQAEESMCGNLDFHRLYFLEIRASRVAPTKLEIEKGCGNQILPFAAQTLKPVLLFINSSL